jgi:hypothetical protein
MKGTLHKTEQGWVVRYLQTEPKYIGERQSLQGVFIHPDYVALCSYSFYEGKEVEFEILQGADVLYAHLFKSNPKEKQKQLITEIMDLDAKDGLYEHSVSPTYTGEYPFPPKDKCKQNDTVNDVDADFPIEHKLASVWVFDTNASKWSNNDDTAGDNHASFIAGYLKAKETLYTEEQVREAIDIARKGTVTDAYGDLEVLYSFEKEEIIQSLKQGLPIVKSKKD